LEEPITLPCQITVCLKHLNDRKDKNSINECYFCVKSHQICLKNLIINKEIQNLIESKNEYIKINTIDLGENNRLARDSCEILNEVLKEVKFLSNYSHNYIYKYFNGLKLEINHTRELYVQLIENKYDFIMKKIIESENDCKTKAKQSENYLKKLIIDIESKLNTWNESLKVPNFSKDNEWKSIRFDVAKEIQRIEDEIEKYQDNILLNKVYEFIPIPIIDENNFGNFNVKNIDVGKISMVLNLSKLNSMLIDSKELCVIKDIPWVIQAQLSTKDKVDYLGFYVAPKCEEERIKVNPIDTKITFKISQNEARKTKAIKKENHTHKFEKPIGRGYNNFISKDNLLNLSNGFYNKETNSILLEATVKIIS